MNKKKHANKTDLAMILVLGLVAAAVIAAVWLAPRFLREKNRAPAPEALQASGEAAAEAPAQSPMSEAQKAASELPPASKYTAEEIETLQREESEGAMPDSDGSAGPKEKPVPLSGKDAVLGYWETADGFDTVRAWREDDGTVRVEMDREDDAANTVEFLQCTVTYQEEKDVFIYKDAAGSRTDYSGDGDPAETAFADGGGMIAVRGGQLYWRDDRGEIPADMTWIYIGEY